MPASAAPASATAPRPAPRRAVRGVLLAVSAGVVVLFVMNLGYLTARLGFWWTERFGGRPETLPTLVVVTEPPAPPVERVAPMTLWIPRIAVEVPIVTVRRNDEIGYQEALLHGVGLYPGTPEPGAYGNPYIFGHSSDYSWSTGGYKTVFALLPELEVGDRIIASDGKGDVFTYAVTETKVVLPDDKSVLDQFGNQKRMLTLQTSYPLGTALRRYIVIAELVAEGSGDHERAGEADDE
jgi:LPXTG-site transpeptidase (sortase) family protein